MLRWDRRRRNDSDVTIGVGAGGVIVGPRQNCRMVTTTVERDDGRTITRKEPKLRAIRPRPGNIGSHRTAWWAREDSNLQPDRYIRTLAVRFSLCLTLSSNYRPAFPRTPRGSPRLGSPPAASASVRR